MSCGCFFKQKTAYEMRISDWSSDVCSFDLQNKRDQASDRDQTLAYFGREVALLADGQKDLRIGSRMAAFGGRFENLRLDAVDVGARALENIGAAIDRQSGV